MPVPYYYYYYSYYYALISQEFGISAALDSLLMNGLPYVAFQ